MWQTAYMCLLLGRLGERFGHNLHKSIEVSSWKKEKSGKTYHNLAFA